MAENKKSEGEAVEAPQAAPDGARTDEETPAGSTPAPEAVRPVGGDSERYRLLYSSALGRAGAVVTLDLGDPAARRAVERGWAEPAED